MSTASAQTKTGQINVASSADPSSWARTAGIALDTPNPDLQKALKVVAVLQTTLNVEKVINLFARELEAAIAYDGLCYYNDAYELAFNLGKSAQHSCTYQLTVDGKPLGEFSLSRDRQFSESETMLLEYLLCGLVYPLRNALLYRHAATVAIKDPLTGIYNRAMLETALVREVGLARHHKNPLSIIMMDIDRFKSVNDKHGHAVGDDVLKALSTCVSERIRTTDILARYGGEDFTVLLSNTNLDGALVLAERIRSAVQGIEYITAEGEKLTITASMGVAAFSSESADELIARADKALYEAKLGGRNCIKAAIAIPKKEQAVCAGSA